MLKVIYLLIEKHRSHRLSTVIVQIKDPPEGFVPQGGPADR